MLAVAHILAAMVFIVAELIGLSTAYTAGWANGYDEGLDGQMWGSGDEHATRLGHQ